MYMFARKSRLLGKARPYYLIVPLLKQRFREMKGQAQHDRRKCVIPSVAEESRGNEPLGLITAIPPPQKNAKKKRGAAVKNRKPAFRNY